LFFNEQGKHFDDISLISGVDTPADSRSFCLFDYDHDGRQDIALVNANTPLLNLYRNSMVGQTADDHGNGFIAVRFRGGNETPSASKLACRDGYGAVVTVVADGKTIRREHRCGEGYGAQNSKTMIIGIGDTTKIDSFSVRWPNGTQTEVDVARINPGSLVAVREADQIEPVTVQAYAAVDIPIVPDENATESVFLDVAGVPSLPAVSSGAPKLRLYMTMATWCVACKEQTPYLASLADRFSPEELEIVGLPIDPQEDANVIREYAEVTRPPYRQVLQLTATQRRTVNGVLSRVAPPDAIPASVLTDSKDRVLQAFAGVPSVSDLRKFLKSP
jgi:thiol-disulfide isomerase/thioredoxin